MHRYALAIGWPVPLLRKIMSASDIAEAMAFDTIEPFGPMRADLRAGIIASTIANVNRGKNSKPFKPSDFMPRWGKPKSKQEELKDKLKAIFKNGNSSKSIN